MEATIKAGFSEVVITPPIGCFLAGYFTPRKSRGVAGDLYARTAVFSDGDEAVSVTSCDLIGLDAEIVREARELAEDATGIPGDNMMICATHTHTGPYTVRNLMGSEARDEDYLRLLPRLIAGSIAEACRHLRKAEARVGLGQEDSVVFNRRYVMRDGRVATNPGRGNPDIVRPAGPVDPQLTVLSIYSPSGLTGLAVNYANHVDVVGGDLISPDYPGLLASMVKKFEGGDVVTLFLNGAFGDVNHIDVANPWQLSGAAEALRIAGILAGEAFKTIRKSRAVKLVPLEAARSRLKLPVRKPSREAVEAAREALARGGLSVREEVYARELLALSRMGDYVDAEIQALRLGELVLIGLPGEPFCEHGLRLKAVSPFNYTMVVGLANGYLGYIPTVKAFQEGGYEVRLARHTKLAPEAVVKMMTEAEKLLGQLGS